MVGGAGCSGPGDGVAARLVAQDGAPELHSLAQDGAHVVLLLAVEDRRQASTAALLQLDLPVTNWSKIVYYSLYFKLSQLDIQSY